MKKSLQSLAVLSPVSASLLAAVFACVALDQASAADKTWNGAGGDGYWHNAANWASGALPAAGDSLFFSGTVGLANTNNYSVNTVFNGITFNGPGGFALSGNGIDLGGGITNNQVVTLETINLPLSLSITPDVDVVQYGSLAINGAIAGTGGIAKSSGGMLTLAGANSFAGPVSVMGGGVSIGAADNLGGSTQLTLDNGALETTASLTLNSAMGIAVGSGGGWGTLTVDPGTTLTYGGVIADNGGTGTLVKNGFGTLVLSGANTYSGATSNRVGNLTLDFTQAGSPTDNIIAPGSDLTLGGENAGIGAENEAELDLTGAAGATNSQTFHSTHLTFAGSVIRPTSGSSGQMNLNLGTLSHDPGGTLVIIPPAKGNLTTTSPNVNGILGGFATIGNGSAYTANSYTVLEGTNYATVDGGGNIVNFSGYVAYPGSGNLNGLVTASDNLLFLPTSPSVMTADNDNAGTTTEVNAIKMMAPDTGSTANYYGIYIGPGNTLRLGKYGGILKNDFSRDVITIGGASSSVQSGSGTTGSGDIGTVTAGGADNTDGEIVMDANAGDETHGTTIFEATISDNGTGKVTFVKTGPGSIKLDGHNTFSGGLYLLQGRVQFAGHEIGNDNPDGGGTGPIYILPGSYLFPSGIGTGNIITNSIYVAGIGDAAEPLGAIRYGYFSGPITLIGDTALGADHTGSRATIFYGPISGAHNLTLGSLATVNGEVVLSSPSNDWTGNTIISARTINGGGNNITTCGTNDVIPHGFGRGNVVMTGGGSGTVAWNLNGFNETINGLSTSGNAANCTIQNNGAAPSVLTIGDNNQSGVFGGNLQDGGSTLALTKIGGGVETLTGNNTYSGPTVVNGGTLALSGSGSIGSSLSIQVNSGASLDVSGVAGGFSSFYSVALNGGALVGNTSSSGIATLALTNAAITLSVDPSKTNLVATEVDTSGANVVNLSSVFNVLSYPAKFTVLKYSALGGAGYNFSLGTVPTSTTTGYLSNDVANSAVVLVLTSGPKALNWVGNVNNDWDVATTANWEFNSAPTTFNNLDSALFGDTASTTTVNVATVVLPGAVTVNASSDYTFVGSGAISGSTSLTKEGTGTLALLEDGGDTFNGGVTVNGGTVVFGANNSIDGGVAIASGATVEVGTNGGAGTLPAGAVDDEGTLDFNRGADLAVPNSISGNGTLLKSDASVLTLAGGNGSFTGAVEVLQGTLMAGSRNALGTADNGTTNASGSTLDVNGQQLNSEPVTVSGAGVGGLGAIINSGPNSQNAMGNVTLAGNTTFGGTGRWDIRGGAAQLATLPPNSPYTLTKVGPNQISLVGVTVDSGLGDINVQGGTLSVETTTTGLGDSTHTLTVSPGATLQFYNTAAAFYKNFVLNGTGTNITLNCGSGAANSIAGAVSLHGACVLNAAPNAALSFNAAVGGDGSVIETGAGTYVIGSGITANYTGSTTISNGILSVDGTLSGNVAVYSGGTLAGWGTASGTVAVLGGAIAPGDSLQPQGTLTVGTLAISNATGVFELASSPGSGNDQITVTGGLTVSGTNMLQIVPPTTMSPGDIYTLFQYGGSTLPSSATNDLVVTSARAGFSFSVLDPATTPGAIKVRVDTAIGNDVWKGQISSVWDTTTANWTRNSNPANFNNLDFVSFDDTTTVTNVSLSGTLAVSGITMNNFSSFYTFSGDGSLTGNGGLHVAGVGMTLANAGSNDFSGPITIDYGMLRVGDGSTNGSLGSGIVTNTGALVFNRAGALTVNNNITGMGSITNIGDGVVTLGGANTFAGEVDVVRGTVQTLNNSALGDTVGATVISDGATLDVGANGVHLGSEPIFVSGAGVDGNGAIINNSGSGSYGGNAGNFNNVTMQGNTTFGGTGRMDMRNDTVTPTLSTGGHPYTLTKVGNNLFQLVDVTVDSALGEIDVKGGTFGIQGNMSLGDPASNLTVYASAELDFYSFANPLDKALVLEDGSTVHVSHSPDLVVAGPVTLNGVATFDAHSASITVSNVISGVGTLRKLGSHNLNLTASETYAGNTVVDGGTLALVGNNLPASPVIDVISGTLDLSQAASTTLTLGAGQVLQGGGTINGSVAAGPGSTVAPGDSIGTLSVANGVTLQGETVMELDAGAGTADQLAAATIAYGGTLTVTNINGTLASGQSFKLFNAPGYSGAFTMTNLPPLAPGLYWTNSLAVDGTIAVAGTAQALPTIGILTSSGNGVIINGTNGAPNGTYYVLTSTNVALPLTQWTPVETNTFNANGGFSFTNSLNPNEPQLFYILRLAP